MAELGTTVDTPCIEFGGYRDKRPKKSYGITRRNGRNVRVHRLVWTLANGPIPEGMLVLHRCDNPPCFRLDHLFLGTHAENMADMKAKGRGAGANPREAGKTHCPKGHPYEGANLIMYRRKTGTINRICRTCNKARRRHNPAGKRTVDPSRAA